MPEGKSDHQKMVEETLERMIEGQMLGGPEGRAILFEIRDKLAEAIGVSKDDQRFLQAHQKWMASDPDMDIPLWQDFGMSEMAFSTLTLQVEGTVEDDATLKLMESEPDAVKRAWVMGYLIGMIAERRTQLILAEGTEDDPMEGDDA